MRVGKTLTTNTFQPAEVLVAELEVLVAGLEVLVAGQFCPKK